MEHALAADVSAMPFHVTLVQKNGQQLDKGNVGSGNEIDIPGATLYNGIAPEKS